MSCLSAWLVLVQDNRTLCTAAGSVQPHIGLAGGCLTGFLQYLQRGLVTVQNRFLAKIPMQHIIDRPQPGIRDIQYPIGHGLPGQL